MTPTEGANLRQWQEIEHYDEGRRIWRYCKFLSWYDKVTANINVGINNKRCNIANIRFIKGKESQERRVGVADRRKRTNQCDDSEL